MIISIINLIFSPIGFILFLFLGFKKESIFFEPTKSTNVVRLKPLPFTIYILIYVSAVLINTYVWSLYSDPSFDVWQVFIPKYYGVSIVIWILTAYTIYVYFKGMEGNVMGFIFFPMLALSSLVLIGINAKDIFLMNWQFNTDFSALQINFWVRILAHVFLPTYILLFIKSDKEEKIWLPVIIASVGIQLILFGMHWLVFRVFGISLNFSEFFGEQQTILYYTPMIFGGIYFLCYHISKHKTLVTITAKLAGLLVILQLVNYYQWIRMYFE